MNWKVFLFYFWEELVKHWFMVYFYSRKNICSLQVPRWPLRTLSLALVAIDSIPDPCTTDGLFPGLSQWGWRLPGLSQVLIPVVLSVMLVLFAIFYSVVREFLLETVILKECFITGFGGIQRLSQRSYFGSFFIEVVQSRLENSLVFFFLAFTTLERAILRLYFLCTILYQYLIDSFVILGPYSRTLVLSLL